MLPTIRRPHRCGDDGAYAGGAGRCVGGVYAGGDAILLEYSNVRPSMAQAYFCSDRAGCVARAEERVRVAQAELEYAQGRLALAHERVSE